MADKMSKEKRSYTMSQIRSKNTSPEILLRKTLWKKGKRFRIHDKTVFGTPDISNKKRRVAVFVDGCFWHGCKRCYVAPKSNIEFWKSKLHKNKERRRKVLKNLANEEWKVIQIWEHDVNNSKEKTLKKILDVW